MSLAVKPGYVSPLSMLDQKKTGKAPAAPVLPDDPNQEVQDLQQKELELQSKLLLLKNSSDTAGSSQESQKNIQKQLEKVSKEIKTAKTETVRSAPAENKSASAAAAVKMFDTVNIKAESKQSPGLYQVQGNGENGYQFQFAPFSEEE